MASMTDCTKPKLLPCLARRAMRRNRWFGSRPNPFISCWENEKLATVCTEGLKNCAPEGVDARLLLKPNAILVPVLKPWVYLKLFWVEWVNKDCRDGADVPVPAVSGLFTGILRLWMLNVETKAGSKSMPGIAAKVPGNEMLPTPRPLAPDWVRSRSVSAIHGK